MADMASVGNNVNISHGSPIPGTVHLIDLDGTLLTKHASGSAKEVVLVPPPSSHPDYPLNWSPKRKALSTFCICLYVLAVGFPCSAIYSILVPVSMNTGLTIDTLNTGTGYMFLFFGWGCAFWQPIALQYGKRPVYLFSLLATLGVVMWVPYTKTNGDWIGQKILQGFLGAPIESLCEVSISVIRFIHDRGTCMMLYGLTLAGSNYMAPVFAGFIADGQSWEWVMYWCAIFCGFVFIILFFFLEETNYNRPATSLNAVLDGVTENTPANPHTGSIDEKTEPTAATSSSMDTSSEAAIPPKTFMQKLSLVDRPRSFSHFKFIFWQPFIFFTYPIVVYAGFAYGSSLVWFNVLNATASLVLSAPPYNFSASMVGLSYLGPALGAVVSALWAGPVGDKLLIRLARRNQGRSEPEHRLWLFALTAIFCPVGLILWGVGAAHSVHWFGLIFAMFILSASITIAIPISCNYAIVTVIIIRNTMSFAINYGITPWILNTGYQNTFVAAAFISLAQVLVFLVFVKWGKGWRAGSKDRYWTMVEESAKRGLAH
ncbi:hypothetical protein BOTNAR_0532g00040 [Botryotinia narcissicola]|uniref:Major facilitator superfamily (MFS) profile domain-containing protein n=1 Tax=Botryotinia narcissicola TaxID=278944 RepID=A0A4Z1HFX2_9HELO|nr:hypothetical protein BOTNAR_0532g00040 [Botryotinia narcissicola]